MYFPPVTFGDCLPRVRLAASHCCGGDQCGCGAVSLLMGCHQERKSRKLSPGSGVARPAAAAAGGTGLWVTAGSRRSLHHDQATPRCDLSCGGRAAEAGECDEVRDRGLSGGCSWRGDQGGGGQWPRCAAHWWLQRGPAHNCAQLPATQQPGTGLHLQHCLEDQIAWRSVNSDVNCRRKMVMIAL